MLHHGNLIGTHSNASDDDSRTAPEVPTGNGGTVDAGPHQARDRDEVSQVRRRGGGGDSPTSPEPGHPGSRIHWPLLPRPAVYHLASTKIRECVEEIARARV